MVRILEQSIEDYKAACCCLLYSLHIHTLISVELMSNMQPPHSELFSNIFDANNNYYYILYNHIQYVIYNLRKISIEIE